MTDTPEDELAHLTAAQRQLQLRKKAPRLRFVNGKAVLSAKTAPSGVTAEERELEQQREALEQEIEHRKNPEPGQMIEGEGIFVGKYAPKDRDGNSLGKIFNVFAAPEDLPETATYDETVRKISELKDWNGHDGTNYANDAEIYAALKDGRYGGGWIIPTWDILHGEDAGDNATAPDSIFAHKDKGAFKEAKHALKTAATVPSSSSFFPNRYWASTESRFNSGVCDVRLSDGNGGWSLKDGLRLSCRPVRLVLAP